MGQFRASESRRDEPLSARQTASAPASAGSAARSSSACHSGPSH